MPKRCDTYKLEFGCVPKYGNYRTCYGQNDFDIVLDLSEILKPIFFIFGTVINYRGRDAILYGFSVFIQISTPNTAVRILVPNDTDIKVSIKYIIFTHIGGVIWS